MSRRRPRILAAYNRYLNRGGEDDVFESDVALLLENGFEVVPVTTRTRPPESLAQSGRFALDTMWSRTWKRRFDRLLRWIKPDVAHFYNTFPAFSPSVYYACHDHGVPVVQAVQNYRLGCPKATLYREGAVCERCLGRSFAFPGVIRRCYHGSLPQSAAVATMVATHRLFGTWSRRVDLWVAASRFSRRKLIACGLPAERVTVKPNFRRRDPGVKRGRGDYALFVGRLSAEKGVATLLDALAGCGEVPVKIAGDGPLLEAARRVATKPRAAEVEVLGRVSNESVMRLMHGARFLVFPSEWYEGQPMTLIEALACGLPVVGSRLGACAEVIEDGVTGRLFTAGDASDLARTLESVWRDEKRYAAMSRRARETYERRYTAERSLSLLEDLYRQLIETREAGAEARA